MRFLNLAHTKETVTHLVAALNNRPSPRSLPVAYREAINTMRPLPALPSGLRVSFMDDEWGQYLVDNRVFENIFEGLTDTPKDKRLEWQRLLSDAQRHVHAASPDLADLVNLIVTDLVLFSSSNKGGGSASHIPGLVSMSPGDAWTGGDFADSLVHEAIHLNAFVADMVYGLYTLPASELAADEHRVVSAVKVGQMRPLDKAFHSAIVAPPLMFLQAQRGETELVDKFSESIRECTDGLMGKLDLFTDYGQLLVKELAEFAETIDLDLVKRSISDPEFAHYEIPVAA